MKIVIIIFVPCNVVYASCMCDAILHHNSISNIYLYFVYIMLVALVC